MSDSKVMLHRLLETQICNQPLGQQGGVDSEMPTSFLTEQESAALTLVRLCFGSQSEEFLRFCKYLVVERHGLEWLDA